MPMAAMEPRMKAMKDMRQKMMAAKSPAERQALMADHMKAMQGGMAMMKEMRASSGASGMGMMGSHGNAASMAGMGGGMSDSKNDGMGPPADMSKRQQMMTDHMNIMQMLMDMMSDRMSPANPRQ